MRAITACRPLKCLDFVWGKRSEDDPEYDQVPVGRPGDTWEDDEDFGDWAAESQSSPPSRGITADSTRARPTASKEPDSKQILTLAERRAKEDDVFADMGIDMGVDKYKAPKTLESKPKKGPSAMAALEGEADGAEDGAWGLGDDLELDEL
mmetsp:Transcript_107470/g.246040  ORF Transcript_107470/g.246040 Transcript_107470/m.246040 type:complete len:151 (-) Transcript_107470:192-644(-)